MIGSIHKVTELPAGENVHTELRCKYKRNVFDGCVPRLNCTTIHHSITDFDQSFMTSQMNSKLIVQITKNFDRHL